MKSPATVPSFSPRLTQLTPPPSLDGRQGQLRERGQRKALTRADDDLEAVRGWLAQFTQRPSTLRGYERALLIYLHWCWYERGIALSSATVEDLAAFERFLADPPAHWVSENTGRRGRKDTAWRPLRGPMSSASRATVLGAVRSCYSALVRSGYLFANPAEEVRISAPPRRSPDVLPRGLITDLFDWVQEQGLQKGAKGLLWRRDAWLLSLLLYGALRIEEAARLQRKDWRIDPEGRPVLEVLGKGGKRALLPISSPLEQARRQFEQSLPEDPRWEGWRADGEAPLVPSLQGRGMTTRGLRSRFTAIMQAYAATYAESGWPLRDAHPHLFRHTALTWISQATSDPALVQAFARHSDPRTTFTHYVHPNMARMREAVEAAFSA